MTYVVLDVETFGIEGRPDYPPRIVGLAVKYAGQPSRYYAFGHVSGGNDAAEDEVRAACEVAYASGLPLVFHNAKFDLDCIEAQWGLPVPSWERIHDTMLLLFLHDSNQTELGLKPSSERLLGWPPEEQDAVADWLIGHQPVTGVRITRGKRGENNFGKFIAYAPGDAVGPYAAGDVERTAALFDLLYSDIVARDMVPAYERERRLLPILLEMERQGVRVDLPRLRDDVAKYGAVLAEVDDALRERLGAPGLNVDSGTELIAALAASGLVDPDTIPRTEKTGAYKSDKATLEAVIPDKATSHLLRYRGALATALGTFMRPWLATAERSGGRIFTSWNQVAMERNGGKVGARTGRLSSTPNFQNIPKAFPPLWEHEKEGLPPCPLALPALPLVRSYVVPEVGHTLIDRDFVSQEPRIFAHFEDGELKSEYISNPWTDPYEAIRRIVLRTTGKEFTRKDMKVTLLGLLYSKGSALLATELGVTLREAQEVKAAVFRAIPGAKDIADDLKRRARSNLPFRTWGGRELYCEPPKVVDGEVKDFSYRMLNHLIQGSAADCTKEAVIRYAANKGPGRYLLALVHDELLASVPLGDVDGEMGRLREAMTVPGFDVPMLSDGKTGATWTGLRPFTDPEFDMAQWKSERMTESD